MYGKGDIMMARKGEGSRLLGAIKGAGRLASEPLVQFGVGLVAPEVGVGLGALSAARKSNLLKKAIGM